MGEIFNTFLVHPIINVLVAIYQVLLFLNFPYALGFSIVVLTILIRFLLYPLISSQLKASRKMQELSPHLSRLKEKHKGDTKTLQQETMKLYKEFGVNPASGCLPVLIQLPIIWALYSVLQQIVTFNSSAVVSEVNKIIYPSLSFLKLNQPWDQYFFGLPLGQTPAKLLPTLGILVILVPVATGIFQFVQSKMMFAKPKNLQVEGVDPKKKDDFASVFQSQSLYIFPVMIAFFSYTFAIGLSLYWNTFTVFGIVQQYLVNKSHETKR